MINLKLANKFFLIILFSSLLISFFTKFFIDNELISNILVAFNSLLVLFFILSNFKDNSIKFLLILFFLLRLFLLYLDFYGKEFFNILHSGGDSERFYALGIYISKDLSLMSEISYTKYTDFLGILYWIIGDQRLFSQFINVILGMWSIFVFYKILGLFNLKDSKKLFFFTLYALYPQNIILSSILLREELIQFFFIYSIFFFLKWLKTYSRSYIFLTLLFALLSSYFHSGMIFSVLVFCYMFLFLNAKNHKFIYSFNRLAIFILCAGLIFTIIANNPSLLDEKFSILQKVDIDIGLIEMYESTSSANEAGGSSYLKNFEISSFADFLIFAPLKLIYFIFSPMPYDVRGLGDLIAILIDSSIYYFLIFKIFKNRKIVSNNKFRAFPKVFFILFLIVSLGFSFGTETSGTAMRHRAKIFPALLVAVVFIESIKGTKNSIWNDKQII